MQRVRLLFLLMFVAFATGTGLIGYLYFHVQEQLYALKDAEPTITYVRNIEDNLRGRNNIGVGSTQSATDLQSQMINVVEQAGQSVVNIVISKNIEYYLHDPLSFRSRGKVIQKKEEVGGGSGIIISKDGLIITNKHVVQDPQAQYSIVLNNGNVYQASRIWMDPMIDLAVLQIVDQQGNKPTDLMPASFVDFHNEVRIGQFALAIGNALAEYQNSVSLGIISAKNRRLSEEKIKGNRYIGLYQTDTSINPGNSGGPLIDIAGNVLWITTAINAIGEGIGFALPVNRQFIGSTIRSIQDAQAKWYDDGIIKRPFLGISYQDITHEIQKKLWQDIQGVLVQQVIHETPAHQVGMQAGDIITKVNGQAITKQLPFLYHIYKFSPNEIVTLTTLRDQKTYQFEVKLWIL